MAMNRGHTGSNVCATAMQGVSENSWGSCVRRSEKWRENPDSQWGERFCSGETLHVVGGDRDFSRGLVYFYGIVVRYNVTGTE